VELAGTAQREKPEELTTWLFGGS